MAAYTYLEVIWRSKKRFFKMPLYNHAEHVASHRVLLNFVLYGTRYKQCMHLKILCVEACIFYVVIHAISCFHPGWEKCLERA